MWRVKTRRHHRIVFEISESATSSATPVAIWPNNLVADDQIYRIYCRSVKLSSLEVFANE
jgi:hypothetical protein